MYKVLIAFVISSLVLVNSPVALAATSRSSSRPSTSRPVSRPSSRPSTSAPRTSSVKSTPKTSKVGTKPLKSRTTAPKPHTHNGQTFNSSTAPYTNSRGLWVYWWIPVLVAGHQEIHCFDKDHKRITCDRDKNAYQKDW